jgi:U3 small nucleolar RNA-associated protein 4
MLPKMVLMLAGSLQATVDSYGGPVWALAVEPAAPSTESPSQAVAHRARAERDDSESSDESDSDDEDEESGAVQASERQRQRVAVACDDGCARLFAVDDATNELQYAKALPRVEGEETHIILGYHSEVSTTHERASLM